MAGEIDKEYLLVGKGVLFTRRYQDEGGFKGAHQDSITGGEEKGTAKVWRGFLAG